MELIEYISKDKVYIEQDYSIDEILKLFNSMPYSHIPIIKNQKLVAIVAKEDLNAIDDPKQKLSNLEYLYEAFSTKSDETLLKVLSDFAVNNTNILPVTDIHNNYIGYLDLSDVLDCLSSTEFLNTDGNILLLQKDNNEYSMAEICQIVESNNNSVLGCFVNEKNENKTLVTLKIKPTNINELIQSFRRYDYEILNTLSEDLFLDGLKKRSEYFIKYLNI